MLSFVMGICLGVELLDQVITLCLTVWGTADCFPPLSIPISRVRALIASHPDQPWLLSDFLTLVILLGVRWYLIVVLM